MIKFYKVNRICKKSLLYTDKFCVFRTFVFFTRTFLTSQHFCTNKNTILVQFLIHFLSNAFGFQIIFIYIFNKFIVEHFWLFIDFTIKKMCIPYIEKRRIPSTFLLVYSPSSCFYLYNSIFAHITITCNRPYRRPCLHPALLLS